MRVIVYKIVNVDDKYDDWHDTWYDKAIQSATEDASDFDAEEIETFIEKETKFIEYLGKI